MWAAQCSDLQHALTAPCVQCVLRGLVTAAFSLKSCLITVFAAPTGACTHAHACIAWCVSCRASGVVQIGLRVACLPRNSVLDACSSKDLGCSWALPHLLSQAETACRDLPGLCLFCCDLQPQPLSQWHGRFWHLHARPASPLQHNASTVPATAHCVLCTAERQVFLPQGCSRLQNSARPLCDTVCGAAACSGVCAAAAAAGVLFGCFQHRHRAVQ